MTDLKTIVDHNLVGDSDNVTMRQESLDQIMTTLLGPNYQEAESVYCTQTFLESIGRDNAEFQVRSGGWVVHISRNLAQTLVSAIAMGIILKIVTRTDLALAIIPAVLPSLFQVEKTVLSMKDEEVLMQLHPIANANGKTPDELYEALPQTTRQQINRLDFLEFLDAVSQTGHARKLENGNFQLSHPDHPRFIVKII